MYAVPELPSPNYRNYRPRITWGLKGSGGIGGAETIWILRLRYASLRMTRVSEWEMDEAGFMYAVPRLPSITLRLPSAL